MAKVWKNGVETAALTDGSNSADGRSIFVKDNIVYVAGRETITNHVAKIWKDGVETALTDGAQHAFANAIRYE